MNAGMDPMKELNAHYDMMALFDELPFLERIRRVIHGLRQPPYSGDYKYARLQLLRLSAPIAAVLVPFLVIGLILLVGPLRPSQRTRHGVILQEPVPDTELDEPEPLPEVELPPPDPEPALIPQNIVAPPHPKVGSPHEGPAEIPDSGILETKSPLIFQNLPKGRTPGGRRTLLKKHHAPPTAETAVLLSLRWLRDVQESDGSWNTASGEEGRDRGSAQPAMTGLALLTFLGYGETPNSRTFGHCVQKGLEWLLMNQQADGRFRGRDQHDYSHPIATYALCEAYGMNRGNPSLRDAAERALAVIVNGQNANGLWNYNCLPSSRSDTSYSGWCIQALKAAHIADLGGDPLREALARAATGLPSLAHPSGAFGYTAPGQHNLTCAGVLSLQLLGGADDALTNKGLAWLSKRASCDWEKPWGKSPVYYWYYTTQAMFHAGGSEWEKWNEQFAEAFVDAQTVLPGAGSDKRDIGYWNACVPTEHSQSRVYTTTLCALSLEVYYKLGTLLLFQDLDTMDHEDLDRTEDKPIDIDIRIDAGITRQAAPSAPSASHPSTQTTG